MKPLCALLLPIVLALLPATALAASTMTPDGGRYQGEMRDGLLHGHGQLEWPNGDRYVGDFRDGLMAGRGILESASGDRYEGEMADGRPHGQGVRVFADGSRYEGEFEQGYESGQGALVWADGAEYTGSFVHGRPSGRGRIVYPIDATYEGEFEQGSEHGEGVMTLSDGTRYAGRFERGQPRNARWEGVDGGVYEGEFMDWSFSGDGRYWPESGGEYTGRFDQGYLVEGTHRQPDGSAYEGEFSSGMYHGIGRWEGPDGSVQEGRFEWGEYIGPEPSLAETLMESASKAVKRLFGADERPPVDPDALLAEQALYLQPQLMQAAIAGLAEQRPDAIDLYAIHVAGDGGQEVFRREVEYARNLFAEDLGAAGRIITLINSRTSIEQWPMATRKSLRQALSAVADRMDPHQDILFLYLTSHGSPEHEFSIEQNGMNLPDLSAVELGDVLRELDLRYKVVVVSACYSGGFIPHLTDDRTLVMTAASADRTSFGCNDENDFTDFGRALLEDGLGSAPSFVAAFETAAGRVARQEEERELTPSQPQIHREPSVEDQLRAWRRQQADR